MTTLDMSSTLMMVLKQMICICTIVSAPLLAMLSVGELQIFHELNHNGYLSAIWSIRMMPMPNILRLFGLTFILISLAYWQLPFSMVPSFIPFVGGIDKSAMKVIGILGASLLAVSWNFDSTQEIVI